MKVLLLAPEPFYIDRGTPISVDLILRALSERGEQVDVVTYHLGRDVHYEGVRIHRIPRIPFINEIGPGFSLKKVICDLFLTFKILGLVLREQYHVVHAVEESVFLALILKLVLNIPYVYDMDSSLVEQMLEKHPRLFGPFDRLMDAMEGLAIHQAKAVVPVCEALSHDIEKYNPEKIMVLHDVSLLSPAEKTVQEDLRAELGIEGTLMMYVGNLEYYQGIDLLLESFALSLKKKSSASLVIIGGKQSDIAKYQALAGSTGIQKQVHFLGPKPVQSLAGYLSQADILVSPRIKGMNTPMKIFSYLDSGKALLATNLPTHTQILNGEVAMLADATSEQFASGMLRLVENPGLRRQLGRAGKKFIARRHTYHFFRESINSLYDWLHGEVGSQQTPPSAAAQPSRLDYHRQKG